MWSYFQDNITIFFVLTISCTMNLWAIIHTLRNLERYFSPKIPTDILTEIILLDNRMSG